MPAQAAEMSLALKDSNDEFDLMIGDLETEIPELVDSANSHIGTFPQGCDSCTCVSLYCS